MFLWRKSERKSSVVIGMLSNVLSESIKRKQTARYLLPAMNKVSETTDVFFQCVSLLLSGLFRPKGDESKGQALA